MIRQQCDICQLPTHGEVVVWQQGQRDPLVVAVCSTHKDGILLELTKMIAQWKGGAPDKS